MLAYRCCVALEETSSQPAVEWPLLEAQLNHSVTSESLFSTLVQPNSVHVFASQTAIKMFIKAIDSSELAQREKLPTVSVYVCGVGATTDQAVRSLSQLALPTRWNFPNLGPAELRENGLHWTLEKLEKDGLVPRNDFHLWTKALSTSDKILKELRSSRQWLNWQTYTHEIYNLSLTAKSIPHGLVIALTNKTPVCLGVKSAELLDATLAALLEHLKRSTVSELPRNIHFSVWEKSALQRAQQLFIQSRLIPWNEFESHVNTSAAQISGVTP
ncbi:hypothetical protein EBU99_11530 [bacterium]|nr:hypothetical protein [bacterium]